MLKKILLFAVVFIIGFLASSAYTQFAIAQKELQTPVNNDGGYEYSTGDVIAKMLLSDKVEEKASPTDRIKENQISVNNERVLINLKNAEWASFTDTNSMDPIIDEGANAIEVIPKSEDEVQAGDIVAYESEYADGIIIHRIALKSKDEKGTYFIIKGDNNPTNDPGKVRFSQIKRVVVAIIY